MEQDQTHSCYCYHFAALVLTRSLYVLLCLSIKGLWGARKISTSIHVDKRHYTGNPVTKKTTSN